MVSEGGRSNLVSPAMLTPWLWSRLACRVEKSVKPPPQKNNSNHPQEEFSSARISMQSACRFVCVNMCFCLWRNVWTSHSAHYLSATAPEIPAWAQWVHTSWTVWIKEWQQSEETRREREGEGLKVHCAAKSMWTHHPNMLFKVFRGSATKEILS